MHPRVQLPHILGHEIAAEVVEVAEDVTNEPDRQLQALRVRLRLRLQRARAARDCRRAAHALRAPATAAA